MAIDKKPADIKPEDLLGDTDAGLDKMLAETAHDEGDNEGIDPNHPLLTVEDQRAARDLARKKVLEEKRDAAFDALVKAERERLLGKEGLRTGDPTKDEMVHVTLDLAEHSDRIVINGATYMHGQTYKLPRHVADTLREIQSRGHNHQNEIDGKGIADRFRRPHNTVVDTRPGKGGAISNAPAAVA